MALADNPWFERTVLGSEIAAYRAGNSGKRIFVVGGLGGRSIAESPMGAFIEAAARFGARGTIVDISGTGKSVYRGDLTMDLWLGDLEHVYLREGPEPSIWIGASLGAWLMLLLQRRHPGWFVSMCALAPAWDWDTQFLEPGVESGALEFKGDDLMVGVAPLPRALVASMAAHHVLDPPYKLSTVLHVIHGERDVEAPISASRQLASEFPGKVVLESLPEGDHGVARLATPESRKAFEKWLFEQVSGRAVAPR